MIKGLSLNFRTSFGVLRANQKWIKATIAVYIPFQSGGIFLLIKSCTFLKNF